MRKFDPWPVFFKREFNRNWPFLVGFAITGTIITKLSLGLTEEDRKKSVFAQRHKRFRILFCKLGFLISGYDVGTDYHFLSYESVKKEPE
uniref:Uncharacterized protein n=1 Tax=Lactuca sativa TaxID=4236 RepID=A0A9R1X7V2_LACSA|nr:hypothetical protein LSAT_V11C500290260 [Lactuca sativa]